MMVKPLFEDDGKRRELFSRLNEIDGISIPIDAISKRPSLPLQMFADEKRLAKFFEVMNLFVAEVHR
jgi:hypothetical protein